MKKKVLALLLCAAAALGMTACGDKGESADSTETVEGTEQKDNENTPAVDLAKYNLNGKDYVTLCDYSEIPVTITGNYDVTDEDVDGYLEQVFAYSGPFFKEDTTKTTVSEGDIVNVDYVGKLDGEAFEGGTAESQNIDVSNNSSAGGGSYIDGFTDDLLGASVGDVIDSDVTFPDDYGNADLAGKDVVFTFTVNSIQKEISVEDIDDEFASEQFGAESVEEMYQLIRGYLEANAKSDYTNDLYSAIQDYLLANCTVDMPADYRADVLAAVRNNFIQTYCGGDESQMESVMTSYGYTKEQMEQEWSDGVESSIQLELIVKAIAEKEGIEADEEEYQSYVDAIVTNGGFGDTDTLYENYGYGDIAYGENQMRVIYTAGMVLERLSGTAVITEETPDAGNAQTTETVETTEE